MANGSLWRFKWMSSGMLKAALQWKVHDYCTDCTATLNTGANLSDVAKGSIRGVPIGL